MLRRVLLTLALLLPAMALVAIGAPVAHAADGLSITSTTTYTIDAEASVVRVRGEFTLTNTLTDQVNGTNVERRYFTGFSVPAPSASAGVTAATANGTPLAVSRRALPDIEGYVLYDIDFAADLFYRDSARVVLTYDITGEPPRSENPPRVNPAYAAFNAFGVGDEREVTVRVVVPAGFEVDVLGSDTAIASENGTTVYTATDIPDPDEFEIFVSARNDAALDSELLTTTSGSGAGDDFDVRSWPGDTEWRQFVGDLISTGVPELEALIGSPWPITDRLEVRQAYTPYLYGYAGWFSAAEQQIEVGEDLDPEVVLHELSHAWFSEVWFSDRWINEGLSQVYSNKAVGALGGAPQLPIAIDPADPGTLALNDWGDPDFTDGADERESYGYNAAFSVVQQIIDEVGDDGMRVVFDAVADRTIAYVGDVDPEVVDTATDWRRFLDLVEELGGATVADDLIEQYVTNPTQADQLPARAAARSAYASLVEEGGEWAPPLAVRERMAAWAFSAAETSIGDAEEVLALRDTLAAKSAQLDIGYPDTFEADYEAADADLTGVSAAMQAQTDTADTVLAAVAAEARGDGVLETIGFWGTDVPALLDSATTALEVGDLRTAEADAQHAIQVVDEASSVGLQRLSLALGGLVLFVSVGVGAALLTRRRRQPAGEESPAAAPDADWASSVSGAGTEDAQNHVWDESRPEAGEPETESNAVTPD